jgi:hypothetical protein
MRRLWKEPIGDAGNGTTEATEPNRTETKQARGDAEMRVADLPLDTWVVIEPLSSGEFNLLSTHATQGQAEAERDDRNRGLQFPRYSAVRALAPAAGAQGCCAVLMHR